MIISGALSGATNDKWLQMSHLVMTVKAKQLYMALEAGTVKTKQ
jgi:hypothetical protein